MFLYLKNNISKFCRKNNFFGSVKKDKRSKYKASIYAIIGKVCAFCRINLHNPRNIFLLTWFFKFNTCVFNNQADFFTFVICNYLITKKIIVDSLN